MGAGLVWNIDAARSLFSGVSFPDRARLTSHAEASAETQSTLQSNISQTANDSYIQYELNVSSLKPLLRYSVGCPPHAQCTAARSDVCHRLGVHATRMIHQRRARDIGAMPLRWCGVESFQPNFRTEIAYHTRLWDQSQTFFEVCIDIAMRYRATYCRKTRGTLSSCFALLCHESGDFPSNSPKGLKKAE